MRPAWSPPCTRRSDAPRYHEQSCGGCRTHHEADGWTRQPAPQMHAWQPHEVVGLIGEERAMETRPDSQAPSAYLPRRVRSAGQEVHEELDLAADDAVRLTQAFLDDDAAVGEGQGDGHVALTSLQAEPAAQRRRLGALLRRVGQDLLQVLSDHVGE